MKRLLRRVLKAAFTPLRNIGVILPERLFQHLHFVGPFTMKLPQGSVRMYSFGHSVENRLYWRGWDGHEPEERRLWAQMVAQGGDILDIGANTASYAITAKALSPASKVFAFEPLRRVADLAAKNIETSGLEISLTCAAVGKEEGQFPIYDPGGDNVYSASLEDDFLEVDKDSYLVDVTTIDAFCKKNGLAPRAIKIDVEGAEGKVIIGAAQTLANNDCLILCEWLGKSAEHKEAEQLLSSLGYVAFDCLSGQKVDLSPKNYVTRNLYFKRD